MTITQEVALITALIVEGPAYLALHLYRAFQTLVMNDYVQLSDNARVAVPFVLMSLNYRKANQLKK